MNKSDHHHGDHHHAGHDHSDHSGHEEMFRTRFWISTNVNETMITGESRPVPKESGDHVVAGTVNGPGSLRIRVRAIGDETTLAGIMRMVEQAQQSKSRSQVLADKAAGWLFYLALASALITAVVWTAITGFDSSVL